jgi:micrococcal nuclease
MDLYNYKAKVLDVVDGDTLDVSIDLGFDISTKIRVRLYGVNAPESRTTDLVEKVAGLASKDFVKSWVNGCNSNVVITTIKDEKEKYGRLLANVYYSSDHAVCLNSELVANGFAKVYFGGKR